MVAQKHIQPHTCKDSNAVDADDLRIQYADATSRLKIESKEDSDANTTLLKMTAGSNASASDDPLDLVWADKSLKTSKTTAKMLQDGGGSEQISSCTAKRERALSSSTTGYCNYLAFFVLDLFLAYLCELMLYPSQF